MSIDAYRSSLSAGERMRFIPEEGKRQQYLPHRNLPFPSKLGQDHPPGFHANLPPLKLKYMSKIDELRQQILMRPRAKL